MRAQKLRFPDSVRNMYIQNRTCKKFKFDPVRGREASSGTFLRHNRYYVHVCYVTRYCKNKALVQKLTSQGGKSRFRPLEIQNFDGGTSSWTPSLCGLLPRH